MPKSDKWFGFIITFSERAFSRSVDVCIKKGNVVIKRLVSDDKHKATTEGVSWIDNNLTLLSPLMKGEEATPELLQQLKVRG